MDRIVARRRKPHEDSGCKGGVSGRVWGRAPDDAFPAPFELVMVQRLRTSHRLLSPHTHTLHLSQPFSTQDSTVFVTVN